MSRSGKCLFCNRRKCQSRIYTLDGQVSGPEFDEVACHDHCKQLEFYADAFLDYKQKRVHQYSSDVVRRGDPKSTANEFASLAIHQDGAPPAC